MRAADRRCAGTKRKNSPCVLRVPEIERLLKDRVQCPLPEDDDGRDSLFLALSHVVRTRNGEVAARDFTAKWAPWCGDCERDALISNLVATPVYFNAAELGKRFNLTMDERTQLDIRTFRAADVSEEQARKIMAARHAERQRRYRQKQAMASRELKARMARRVNGVGRRSDLSPRARELFARLAPGKWTSLPDIARAWTDGEVGALTLKTRRTTVARLMKELRAVALVEVREGRTRNKRAVYFLQRIPDEHLTAAHAHGVAMVLRQTKSRVRTATGEKAEKIDTSDTSDCDKNSVRHTPDDCDNVACVMSYSLHDALGVTGQVWPPSKVNVSWMGDGALIRDGGAARRPRPYKCKSTIVTGVDLRNPRACEGSTASASVNVIPTRW